MKKHNLFTKQESDFLPTKSFLFAAKMIKPIERGSLTFVLRAESRFVHRILVKDLWKR